MSVELSIVVVWVLFPAGLACIASSRIGRSLARMRGRDVARPDRSTRRS